MKKYKRKYFYRERARSLSIRFRLNFRTAWTLRYVIARFIGESRRRSRVTNMCRKPPRVPANISASRLSKVGPLFDLVSHVDRKLARPGDLVATSWAISHPCRASPSSTARTEAEVTSFSLWSTIRRTCLRSTSKSRRVTMPRPREGESREERYLSIYP